MFLRKSVFPPLLGKMKRKREEVAQLPEEEDAKLTSELFQLEEELDQKEIEKQGELLQLEVQLFNIKKPLYKKRDETIAKIPGFWGRTWRGHPVLCSMFTDQDKQLIKSLKTVSIGRQNEYSMSLELELEPNPYLETLTLKKEIVATDDKPPKVTVTPLKWKQKDKNSFFDLLFDDDENRGTLDIVYEVWEEPIPFFTGTHDLALFDSEHLEDIESQLGEMEGWSEEEEEE